MNCQSCGDVGMIRVPWSDVTDVDFAICLCAAGQEMRNQANVKPTDFALWQVWAAREQVDPSRVFLLEEILTPQELVQRGFSVTPECQQGNREAALLAAGKGKRVKL